MSGAGNAAARIVGPPSGFVGSDYNPFIVDRIVYPLAVQLLAAIGQADTWAAVDAGSDLR